MGNFLPVTPGAGKFYGSSAYTGKNPAANFSFAKIFSKNF